MNDDTPEPTPPPSSSSAFNLDDLRLLPDWMKEDAPAPPGAAGRRHGDEQPDDRSAGGGSGPGRERPPRGPHRREEDRRPPRPGRGAGGGGGFRGEGRPPRPGGGGSGPEFRGDRRGGPRDRRGDGGPPSRRFEDRRPAASTAPSPTRPAPVRVEFLPDERPLVGIAKEIRSRHLAYPLFGLARMFLERPESHRIRLSVETAPSTPREGGLPASATTSAPPTPTTLFQLGEDGPVALARASLENLAFDRHRDRFYLAESVQKDPPKGNFTAVARERTSGVLLGPPNHHSYQANLRALYEGRFSRRMGFEEFRRGVEIVNDPALVERWKEEVRTVTTYTVRDTLPPGGINKPNDDKDAQNPPPSGTMPAPDAVPTAEAATTAESAAPPESVTPEPVAVATSEPSETAPAPTPDADRPQSPDAPKPVVFENLGDVRTHFRQHYFDGLLRSGPRLELPGPAGRQLPEASLTLALRLAHERELKYPAGLVQPLRVGLQNTGLHIFKHRKRVVYVSVTRPVPFRSGGEKGGAVSEGVAAILEAIAARPMLSGKDLAARVLARRLGPEETKAAEAPPTVAAAPALTPGESAPPVGATAASESAFAAATPDGADAPGAAVESTPTPIPGSTDPSTVAAAPAGPDASPRQEAVAKARAALAADLRYLVGAGHVIAFHNGTFDLPLPPRPKDPPRPDPAPPINAGGEQPPAPPADTLASTAADTTGEEVPQEVKAATVADGDRERNPAAEEEVAAATDPTTPAAEEGVPTSPTPVAQKVGESSDTATSGEPGV